MFKLYSKRNELWCDFSLRLMQDFEEYATKFETYEEAEEAANVMEAHGWEIQVVDVDRRCKNRIGITRCMLLVGHEGTHAFLGINS